MIDRCSQFNPVNYISIGNNRFVNADKIVALEPNQSGGTRIKTLNGDVFESKLNTIDTLICIEDGYTCEQ